PDIISWPLVIVILPVPDKSPPAMFSEFTVRSELMISPAAIRTLSVGLAEARLDAYSAFESGRTPFVPYVTKEVGSAAVAVAAPRAAGMMLMFVEPAAPPPPTSWGDDVMNILPTNAPGAFPKLEPR